MRAALRSEARQFARALDYDGEWDTDPLTNVFMSWNDIHAALDHEWDGRDPLPDHVTVPSGDTVLRDAGILLSLDDPPEFFLP